VNSTTCSNSLPIVSRAIARQFRGYHENLRRNLEGA
jgi:hypothetical protein